jgi:CubicO group peptidase (beta-lactamase class C family)
MATTEQFPVSGWAAAGFEPVRKVFEDNFVQHGEVGAALHVTLDGAPVVDLWGGAADAAGSRPWEADTLVNVWSTTKGWLALAMHLLAERGLLDFDAPVARYWPEFAQKGKGGVLIRHLLTHTAGLPAPSMKVPDDALYDWEKMVRSLEQSTLFWEPGTKTGYHAATFGWLNGEVLRRITGQSVGQFLRREIGEPLGADVWIGLSAQEQKRAADTLPWKPIESMLFRGMLLFGGRAKTLAFTNPPRPAKMVNTQRWREAEIPSSNGHASARGLARLYTLFALGGCVGDARLLSAAGVERASAEQVHSKDMVAGTMVRRTLGYMLPDVEMGDPRPLTAFGHPGMGGSIGFADPSQSLAMGYVMNQMKMLADTRAASLSRAVYGCLENLKQARG